MKMKQMIRQTPLGVMIYADNVATDLDLHTRATLSSHLSNRILLSADSVALRSDYVNAEADLESPCPYTCMAYVTFSGKWV